ncbi:hypothetical protein [Kushneria sinocarnis]|uniref:hypothetical protein n=1 Tax=Kushneria sinocarnis TaxID=595502 RepID=UPI001472A146|nr:hypothetical protein [Kushneria sinocarnis]
MIEKYRSLMTPEQQAWDDWRQEGAFLSPDNIQSDAKRYMAEAERIQEEYAR